MGEELGAVEGGETISRIYCMRKEYVFNKEKRYRQNSLHRMVLENYAIGA